MNAPIIYRKVALQDSATTIMNPNLEGVPSGTHYSHRCEDLVTRTWLRLEHFTVNSSCVWRVTEHCCFMTERFMSSLRVLDIQQFGRSYLLVRADFVRSYIYVPEQQIEPFQAHQLAHQPSTALG